MISASELDTAFPVVNPGVIPLGARILVQLRTVRERTEGGLIIVQDTRDFNKANTQLGKIVHLGPLSYRNRDTGELWKEGVWARPGDFVRIPKWGGDRFERKIPGSEETALFAIFSDHELVAKIDPEAFTEIDEVL
jgi:co-chaperonin GroES (HSP10)